MAQQKVAKALAAGAEYIISTEPFNWRMYWPANAWGNV
jgi:hypothetical protein